MEMDCETRDMSDFRLVTPWSPVSLATYNAGAAAAKCVPKPEPFKPKQVEKADDSSKEDEEGEEVNFLGVLWLRPYKMLRGRKRVVIGPGHIVPALIRVYLDNDQVIILDGSVGVVRGQVVVKAGQILPDRKLILGMRPKISVEGLLAIDQETLENTARNCGIVSVPLQIDVAPGLMTEVTTTFGPFVEGARYMRISNDFAVQAKGLFQAHAVRLGQHNDFRQSLNHNNRRFTSVKD
ncbi:uncharacterized protein LOC111873309 [Cryptotermes secundus]|uniref:uncharacterized protein LOC111873309 n=1 Tax=Cryptotermes secundus TaxID=105785 RepID=UPI000CD7C0B9|nr:uncharacterized protein LOC111873309 [Cryptotermes secundus]